MLNGSKQIYCTLLVLSLFLSSCVPGASANTTRWFFSAEAWGGDPFSPEEKQAIVVDALSAKRIDRLTRKVSYKVSPELTVRRFVAVFEVDGRRSPPRLRSGYDVSLELPDNAPESVTLTNTETGVAWAVDLAAELASEQNSNALGER